jgi:hypothetical protein
MRHVFAYIVDLFQTFQAIGIHKNKYSVVSRFLQQLANSFCDNIIGKLKSMSLASLVPTLL